MGDIVLNPFVSLRRQSKLTLGELAISSGVDVRALQRSEFGMYTRPLPSLVNYWVLRGAISEGILVSEYEDYQYATRRANHKLFGPDLSFSITSNIHPLRQFRANANLGLVEFCKAVCLPLDSAQWFEKKWRHQKSVPKGFLAAMNQCGYTQIQLSDFCSNYSKWRNNNMGVTFS